MLLWGEMDSCQGLHVFAIIYDVSWDQDSAHWASDTLEHVADLHNPPEVSRPDIPLAPRAPACHNSRRLSRQRFLVSTDSACPDNPRLSRQLPPVPTSPCL